MRLTRTSILFKLARTKTRKERSLIEGQSQVHSIQEGVKSMPPLQVLTEVENTVGGIIGAKAGCDLPRNRQQVYNAKKAGKTYLAQSDTLAEIMRVCKETIATSDAFIQAVEAAPEPMCVLATHHQLTDLERVCTGERFCILSADPTFNLGPFYVTPLTYQIYSCNRSSQVAILSCLDQCLCIRPKHSMPSIISFNSKTYIEKIRAFGTDDESELIRAFQIAFPDAAVKRKKKNGDTIEVRCPNVVDIYNKKMGALVFFILERQSFLYPWVLQNDNQSSNG